MKCLVYRVEQVLAALQEDQDQLDNRYITYKRRITFILTLFVTLCAFQGRTGPGGPPGPSGEKGEPVCIFRFVKMI